MKPGPDDSPNPYQPPDCVPAVAPLPITRAPFLRALANAALAGGLFFFVAIPLFTVYGLLIGWAVSAFGALAVVGVLSALPLLAVIASYGRRACRRRPRLD